MPGSPPEKLISSLSIISFGLSVVLAAGEPIGGLEWEIIFESKLSKDRSSGAWNVKYFCKTLHENISLLMKWKLGCDLNKVCLEPDQEVQLKYSLDSSPHIRFGFSFQSITQLLQHMTLNWEFLIVMQPWVPTPTEQNLVHGCVSTLYNNLGYLKIVSHGC